jgi:hypothetical protein
LVYPGFHQGNTCLRKPIPRNLSSNPRQYESTYIFVRVSRLWLAMVKLMELFLERSMVL